MWDARRVPIMAISDLRKGFAAQCPNGHEVSPIYDLEALRASLTRGQVQYFCFRCGRGWLLPIAEHARLREWLDHLFSRPES
jgi:hypothetical protein